MSHSHAQPEPLWIAATPSEAIPRRHGRAVAVSGREIAVFNLGDRFLAVDNHCPHEGGRLCDGIVAVNAVVCPLHAWKVSLENGAVTCPAGLGTTVPTYPTRVEDGVVMVALGGALA